MENLGATLAKEIDKSKLSQLEKLDVLGLLVALGNLQVTLA